MVTSKISAAPAGSGRPENAAAWRALETVPDPEIPEISVVDLGVIRGVEKIGGEWRVTLTPTYSGCPAYEVMERDIAGAMRRAGLWPAKVVRVLHPPWTTDWMSEKARVALRQGGIAPPSRLGDAAGTEAEIVFAVPCPRCGSRNTEVIAPFGATACKALRRCRECREPFEHFKPV